MFILCAVLQRSLQGLIDWCNANSGFLSFVLTAVYVVATLLILRATHHSNQINRESLKQSVLIEQQRNRPYVIFDLEHQSESAAVMAVLKNTGFTPAIEVKVRIDPKLILTRGTNVLMSKGEHERGTLFNDAHIPFLAPNRQITDLASFGADFYKKHTGSFTIFLEYKDIFGEKHSEKYVINLTFEKERLHLNRKSIHELVVEVEGLRREVEHIGSGFHRPKVITISQKDFLEEQQADIDAATQAFENVPLRQLKSKMRNYLYPDL